MTQNDHVLLELVPDDGVDTAIVRDVFPTAEEQKEWMGERLIEDGTRMHVSSSVFRCRFESISVARQAARLVPGVSRRIVVTTTLDEIELELLARYHIHRFFREDRALDFLGNEGAYFGEEAANYTPPPYDSLRWPAEGLGSSSDLLETGHRLRKLAILESILGREYLRHIYESMAAHPPGDATSDFDVRYHPDLPVGGTPGRRGSDDIPGSAGGHHE
jgi:hypothetical protein